MLALLLASILCNPAAQGAYSMVPTLRWDAAEYATGYELHAREAGATTWTPCAVLPCVPDETGTPHCPGVEWSVPLQRWWDGTVGIEYEFCVTATNEHGSSPECSNVVRVCWPWTIR